MTRDWQTRITDAMPDGKVDDRNAFEVLLAALLVLPESLRTTVALEVERLAKELP